MKRDFIMNRKDYGFSVVEILVFILIFVLASGFIAAIILNANEANSNASASTMTQRELLDATSKITREVSAASEFIYADDHHLQMVTTTNGVKQHVAYFSHDPKDTSQIPIKLPEGMTSAEFKASLPKYSSIVEYRHTLDGSLEDIIRPVVTEYTNPDNKALFTYYDKDNAVITENPVADLKGIRRVAMQFSSNADGRDKPLELATSITPRWIDGNSQSDPNGGVKDSELPPAAPFLRGELPAPTTTAQLEWTDVDGATGYVLYRENRGKLEVATTVDGDTITYDDKGLTRGETYVYHVVASGPGGLSAPSNKVTLIAAPPAPVLTGQAVDLENRLSWNATNGAKEYRLYRVGNSTPIYVGPNTSFTQKNGQDPEPTIPNYGHVQSYYVVANNTTTVTGQVTGGDSENSNTVQLISPPVAPTLSGTHSNGERDLSWTAPANATRYQLQRVSPSATVFNSQTTRTYNDPQAISSATFTYSVRAGNDAGWGPWSNQVTLNPRPAAPTVTVQDYASHPSTRDGHNYVTWNRPANTTRFSFQRDSESANANVAPTTLNHRDGNPGWGSTHAYRVAACNITGCSATTSANGRQAPAPFGITGAAQTKRSGYHSPPGLGNDPGMPLVSPGVTMYWSGASGATRYSINGYNTNANTSMYFQLNAGARHIFTPVAYASNGLSRTGSGWAFQAAPGMVSSARVGMQSHDGYDTRAWVDGNVTPVQGGRSYTQLYVANLSGNWGSLNYSGHSGWMQWGGGRYVFGSFNKRNLGGSPKGSGAWFRTVLNIPSGYSAGSVSGAGASNHPMNFDVGAGNVSYVGWWRVSTSRSTSWQGSYGGSWKDVDYTSANYPSSNRPYFEVFAR